MAWLMEKSISMPCSIVNNFMLKKEDLKQLDESQKKQVLMQWRKHQHSDFSTNFEITPFGESLPNFLVKRGVWNPCIVSARHHAGFMFYHSHLFRNKTALDIGCGTGIIGIVMAKYGAKNVMMSDISKAAVLNAKNNIKRLKLKNAKVIESNLFEKISGKFDCITFMQPYFADKPPKGDTISGSMLASPDLIKKFLKEAKKYLNNGGVIVMPSFDLAGDLNNPAIIGSEFGYKIKTPFVTESTTGLQKGLIAMHELSLG